MGELLHVSSSKKTITMGGRAWSLVYPGVYKKIERKVSSASNLKPRNMVTSFTQTPTELTNFKKPVKKPEEKPAEKEKKDKDWEPDWWMLPHQCHSVDFHYQFREHGPCSPGGTMPFWKTHTRPKDPESEPPTQTLRSGSLVSDCSTCAGVDSDEDVAMSRSPGRRRSVHFEDERPLHRSIMGRSSREVQRKINVVRNQAIQHLENHSQQRRKTLLLVDEKTLQSVGMSREHKSPYHRIDPEAHRNEEHQHQHQHSGFCCERHGVAQALSRPWRSSFKSSSPCDNTIKSFRFPGEVEADNGRQQPRDFAGSVNITPFNLCASFAQQFQNLPPSKVVILNFQDFSYNLTIVHTLDPYPYPWPDWPLFIFTEKLGFEKAIMTNFGSIAGPGTTRAILPTAAHVLIVEHMLEVPSDPRPNAFFDSRTGIIRVYHGNIYGNPNGSLLPVSAQNVQASQLGSSGFPGNPMTQAAASAQVGFGGPNAFAGAGGAPMAAQLPAMMGGVNLNPQMMLLPKVMSNAMYGANTLGMGVEAPQPPHGMKFVAVPIDTPYMLNVPKTNHNNSGSRGKLDNGNYNNNGRNSCNGKNERNHNSPGNNYGGSRNNSNWTDNNSGNGHTLEGSNNNNGGWNSSNNQNTSAGNGWANLPNNNNNNNSDCWSDPNNLSKSANDGGGNTWANGTSKTPDPALIRTSPIRCFSTVVVDTYEECKSRSPKQDASAPAWEAPVESASGWDAPPETPGETASFEGWEAATVVNNDADEIAAKIPGAFSDNGNSSNYNRNNGSTNYNSNGNNNNNGVVCNVNSPRQNNNNNNNNSGNQNGRWTNANVTSLRQSNLNPNCNNNRNGSSGNYNNNSDFGNNNNNSDGRNNGNNNGNGGWANSNANSPRQNNSINNNNNQSSGWEDVPADNNNSNNRNNNCNNNNNHNAGWCQFPKGSPIVNQGDDITRPMDSCITAGSWGNRNNINNHNRNDGNNNINSDGNQNQGWGDKTAAQSTRGMDTGW